MSNINNEIQRVLKEKLSIKNCRVFLDFLPKIHIFPEFPWISLRFFKKVYFSRFSRFVWTLYYIYPNWLLSQHTFQLFQYKWWRQSSLLNKLSHSFCSYSHYLLVQTNLLREMVIIFPRGICLKPVANNHQAIKCDKCNLWIHIKCNKINKQTYTYLQTDTSYWYCMTCTKEFLPFSDTNDEELMQTTIGKWIKFTHIDNERTSQFRKTSFRKLLQKLTQVNTLL